MITAPKRKDNTPCPNAIDRIRVDVRSVSGMAKLIPMASFLIFWLACILVGAAVQLWLQFR